MFAPEPVVSCWVSVKNTRARRWRRAGMRARAACPASILQPPFATHSGSGRSSCSSSPPAMSRMYRSRWAPLIRLVQKTREPSAEIACLSSTPPFLLRRRGGLPRRTRASPPPTHTAPWWRPVLREPTGESTTTWLKSGVASSKYGPQQGSGGHPFCRQDTGLAEMVPAGTSACSATAAGHGWPSSSTAGDGQPERERRESTRGAGPARTPSVRRPAVKGTARARRGCSCTARTGPGAARPRRRGLRRNTGTRSPKVTVVVVGTAAECATDRSREDQPDGPRVERTCANSGKPRRRSAPAQS